MTVGTEVPCRHLPRQRHSSPMRPSRLQMPGHTHDTCTVLRWHCHPNCDDNAKEMQAHNCPFQTPHILRSRLWVHKPCALGMPNLEIQDPTLQAVCNWDAPAKSTIVRQGGLHSERSVGSLPQHPTYPHMAERVCVCWWWWWGRGACSPLRGNKTCGLATVNAYGRALAHAST